MERMSKDSALKNTHNVSFWGEKLRKIINGKETVDQGIF